MCGVGVSFAGSWRQGLFSGCCPIGAGKEVGKVELGFGEDVCWKELVGLKRICPLEAERS